jgi:hypothetical protein
MNGLACVRELVRLGVLLHTVINVRKNWEDERWRG